MHASGTGKAILAAMRPQILQMLLEDMALTPYTSNTHVSISGLTSDLHTIAARGWSYDREERYAGMSCVGAAILNERGEPCAGISVSGPTGRFNGERIADLGRRVTEAAREITELTGGALD
jgi:IclR family acetate operon transcriptional repressor